MSAYAVHSSWGVLRSGCGRSERTQIGIPNKDPYLFVSSSANRIPEVVGALSAHTVRCVRMERENRLERGRATGLMVTSVELTGEVAPQGPRRGGDDASVKQVHKSTR